MAPHSCRLAIRAARDQIRASRCTRPRQSAISARVTRAAGADIHIARNVGNGQRRQRFTGIPHVHEIAHLVPTRQRSRQAAREVDCKRRHEPGRMLEGAIEEEKRAQANERFFSVQRPAKARRVASFAIAYGVVGAIGVVVSSQALLSGQAYSSMFPRRTIWITLGSKADPRHLHGGDNPVGVLRRGPKLDLARRSTLNGKIVSGRTSARICLVASGSNRSARIVRAPQSARLYVTMQQPRHRGGADLQPRIARRNLAPVTIMRTSTYLSSSSRTSTGP